MEIGKKITTIQRGLGRLFLVKLNDDLYNTNTLFYRIATTHLKGYIDQKIRVLCT
jgi:hypothetical protein